MQSLKIASVTLKIIFSTFFSENIITLKKYNNGSFETPKK